MARITVEDCLKKVDNHYDLVLLAKERTSQLNAGAEMLVPEDNDKKTIISLREISEGKVQVDDLAKSAISRLRKEPDENLKQEEVEEEENDDFENLYKGQVSKSGIAILPSKRTRKTPSSARLNPLKRISSRKSGPFGLMFARTVCSNCTLSSSMSETLTSMGPTYFK